MKTSVCHFFDYRYIVLVSHRPVLLDCYYWSCVISFVGVSTTTLYLKAHFKQDSYIWDAYLCLCYD